MILGVTRVPHFSLHSFCCLFSYWKRKRGGEGERIGRRRGKERRKDGNGVKEGEEEERRRKRGGAMGGASGCGQDSGNSFEYKLKC